LLAAIFKFSKEIPNLKLERDKVGQSSTRLDKLFSCYVDVDGSKK
jgi:hypothetical protein